MTFEILHNRKPRILLVQIELPVWASARMWSYTWHLGIEEGLAANGVDFVTLTSTWFEYAREICAGKQFDQVWINDIVHLGVHAGISQSGLEWLASLAPVRVGFIIESTTYSPEEYGVWLGLAQYPRALETNIKYVTHLGVFDEKDAAELGKTWQKPAIWLPTPIPERFIFEHDSSPTMQVALFSGTAYGKRTAFLQSPDLDNLLVHKVSLENRSRYRLLFDSLPMHRYPRGLMRRLKRINIFRNTKVDSEVGQAHPCLTGHESNSRLPVTPFYLLYLSLLRHVRRQSFMMYLRGLQTGVAVVNLPSLFKGYAGRVFEGMAVGRPVISWEVPDRPQTKTLFEDDKEILLFSGDNPSHLAAQIQRVLADPALSNRIVTNARHKLQRFHTTEKRVQQILNWVETGESPTYG